MRLPREGLTPHRAVGSIGSPKDTGSNGETEAPHHTDGQWQSLCLRPVSEDGEAEWASSGVQAGLSPPAITADITR